MRVLAVRGANLASLAGEFAVDLAADPFDRSGIFAITGPTGAGKSTVLDAVSLALYDRTPRLGKGGGPLIGTPGDETRITDSDVRSVLRKGAGHGYAEVDFLGKDGKVYRARWEVRRSRGSGTGRFQNQAVVLRDVETGRDLGGTKTETLARIAERVGLSYDQFRRSVLLAQGEFAAFLKADGRERAELLERITGTDIYTKISVAAFQKAKEVEAELGRLTAERDGVQVLDGEAAAALSARYTAAEREKRQAGERLAEAKRAGAWHQKRGELACAAAAAERDMASAAADWENAGALRDEVRAVGAAQPLRALVSGLEKAVRGLRQAGSALEERRRQLLADTQERDRLKSGLHQAQKSRDAVAHARREAEPSLVMAKELDVRTDETRRQETGVRAAADRAGGELLAASRELADTANRLAEAERDLCEVSEWLERNRSVERVGREWERWRKALQQAMKLLERGAGLSVELGKLGEALSGAREGVARLGESRQTCERLVLEAGREARRSEEAARSCDLDGLRREREVAQRELDGLKGLAGLAREASRLSGATAGAEARAAASERASRQALLESEAASAEKSLVAAALSEAESASQLARDARSLEERRRELRPGRRCPLCGATEHPWGDGASAAAAMAAGQEARVRDLRREADRLGRAGADASARAGAHAAARETAVNDAGVFRESLGKVLLKWGEAALSTGVDAPADPCDGGAEAAVASMESASGQALRALCEREKAAVDLLKLATAARSGFDAARDSLDKAVKSFHDALGRIAELESRHQVIEHEMRSTAGRLEESLAELDVPLAGWPGWREDFARSADPYIAACAERADEWRSHVEAREHAEARIAELRLQVDGLRASQRSAVEKRDEKAGELEGVRAKLAAFQGEMASLFGGRPYADVLGDLDRAQREAAASCEAAAAAEKLATERVSKGEGEASALEEALFRLSRDAESAEAELSDARKEAGLTGDELGSLLSRDERWLKDKSDLLDRSRTRVERAGAVLDERRKELERHDGGVVPSLGAEDAAAALSDGEGSLRRLEEEWVRLQIQAQKDAESLLKRGALDARILGCRESAERWQTISRLIGSADGKKFRTYAQSLTLRVLVAYTNEHLAGLAPRYRVAVVEGSEMELQMVDRDQGDELRGVNSLSGGEGFLVSLALALALSSLTSATTRVESLFIDEGFGTLDPETLDKALAVLDALQASGRQVGVISHVPGLAEKVGARVDVVPVGGGKSRVRVVGAAPASANY